MAKPNVFTVSRKSFCLHSSCDWVTEQTGHPRAPNDSINPKRFKSCQTIATDPSLNTFSGAGWPRQWCKTLVFGVSVRYRLLSSTTEENCMKLQRMATAYCRREKISIIKWERKIYLKWQIISLNNQIDNFFLILLFLFLFLSYIKSKLSLKEIRRSNLA